MRNLSVIAALFVAVFGLAAPHSAQAAGFRHYSASSFNADLYAGKTIIVHVHADWCSVCQRQIRPLRAALGHSSYSAVKAYRVNYDNDRAFLRKYRVRTQSTILIFKHKRLVARVSGITNPDAISRFVARAR